MIESADQPTFYLFISFMHDLLAKWSNLIYFKFIYLFHYRKESLAYGALNWNFKEKLKWNIVTLMENELLTSVTSRCGWQMLLPCQMYIKWRCLQPTETFIFMICQHQFTHHNFVCVVSVLNSPDEAVILFSPCTVICILRIY